MTQAKAIVNPETGKQFLVNANTATMLKEMDVAGVKMGRTSLGELLSGKREEVMGFKLVDVVIDPNNGSDTNQDNNGGQQNGDANLNASGTNNGEAGGVTAADNGGGQGNAAGDAGTQQAGAATSTNAGDSKPAQARKTIRASEPAKSGKVKPVRGGTKIAKGLEMLFKGATQKELEAEGEKISDDLPDFCNRRVTKRGYGIEIIKGQNGADDTFKLRLPAGVDKIAYSAGAPEEDKGDNVKAEASDAVVAAAEAGKEVPADQKVEPAAAAEEAKS